MGYGWGVNSSIGIRPSTIRPLSIHLHLGMLRTPVEGLQDPPSRQYRHSSGYIGMREAAYTAALLTSVGLLLWLSTLTIPKARLAIDPVSCCGLN